MEKIMLSPKLIFFSRARKCRLFWSFRYSKLYIDLSIYLEYENCSGKIIYRTEKYRNIHRCIDIFSDSLLWSKVIQNFWFKPISIFFITLLGLLPIYVKPQEYQRNNKKEFETDRPVKFKFGNSFIFRSWCSLVILIKM